MKFRFIGKYSDAQLIVLALNKTEIGFVSIMKQGSISP